MTQPLVTLVTPTYNQANFIAETVESVLAQTYPSIEYVVIDDGSTDGTDKVMAGYTGRFQYLRQDNVGQSRTINRGLSNANGKYFGYLSLDDVLAPDAIARLVAALESDPSAVCAFPNSDLIDQHSNVIKRAVCRPFDLAALVVRQECYIGPGAIYRADAARRVGDWRSDLRLAPDREFWMRLSREGSFLFLSDALAGYRTHQSSTSYSVVSESVSREYLTVLDDYFETADVPPDIRNRKSEAYGFANFVVARNCFRAVRFSAGIQYYAESVRLYPPLGTLRYVLALLRTVISKPLRAFVSRLGLVGR